MPVLGMGGYFFRSKDPAALKAWYRDHLGVGGGMGTDDKGQSNEWVWFTQSGPMVFEPFKQDSDYFPAEKQVMINLRVSDLEGLLAQSARRGDRGHHQAGMGCDARNRPFRAHSRSGGQSDRAVGASRGVTFAPLP